MNKNDLFKTENKTIMINKKKVELIIRVYTPIDNDVCAEDLSDDKEEQNKIIEKLNRSQLSIIGIVVEVVSTSVPLVEGSDSLWSVFCTGPEDVEQTLKDHDMINNAIKEFKQNIPLEVKRLKENLETLSKFC